MSVWGVGSHTFKANIELNIYPRIKLAHVLVVLIL